MKNKIIAKMILIADLSLIQIATRLRTRKAMKPKNLIKNQVKKIFKKKKMIIKINNIN